MISSGRRLLSRLASEGYKEITLLGQNVNAYGKDFEDMTYGLGDLMDELRKIDIPRIRFTTSHPLLSFLIEPEDECDQADFRLSPALQ